MYNELLPVVCCAFARAGGCLLRGVPGLLLAFLLAACSGSSSSGAGDGDTEAVQPDPVLAEEQPWSLLQLEDDPGLLVEIPDVLVTVTTAAAGVQVAYTRQGQDEQVPAPVVETQFLHMQQCLQVTGVPPLVIVREHAVTPFTITDDVIFDIEGIPVASGSQRSIPILQIQESDFDPSRSNPGFNLRSVMGRMLWLAAGLAERDYPFECARKQPD